MQLKCEYCCSCTSALLYCFAKRHSLTARRLYRGKITLFTCKIINCSVKGFTWVYQRKLEGVSSWPSLWELPPAVGESGGMSPASPCRSNAWLGGTERKGKTAPHSARGRIVSLLSCLKRSRKRVPGGSVPVEAKSGLTADTKTGPRQEQGPEAYIRDPGCCQIPHQQGTRNN